MSESLSADVLHVVGAGANASRPDLYELLLELKPEQGHASTRLRLVFEPLSALALVEHIRAKPPTP